MEATAAKPLDQVAGQEQMDLVSDFTYPLPVLVIAALLGAPLARLEGQIDVRLLLQRFPQLSLPEQELQWLPTGSFRGLTKLMLTL